MASVLAGNSDGKIRVTRTFADRTLYGTSPQRRRKVEQGDTAVLQAPVETYAHEVSPGSPVRNDWLPFFT